MLKRLMFCLLFPGLLTPLAASAADANSVHLVGNVAAVSRTTVSGSVATGMTVAFRAPSTTGSPLSVAFTCGSSMGCWDSWWLSSVSGCTATYHSAASVPGTFYESYTCASSTAYGACVDVEGHIGFDGNAMTVYPDSITALSWYDCSSK